MHCAMVALSCRHSWSDCAFEWLEFAAAPGCGSIARRFSGAIAATRRHRILLSARADRLVMVRGINCRPYGVVDVSAYLIPTRTVATSSRPERFSTYRVRRTVGMCVQSHARISAHCRRRQSGESIIPLHNITLGSVGFEASVGDVVREAHVGRGEQGEPCRKAQYGANGGLTLLPHMRRFETSPSHSSCPGTDTANKGHHAAHSHPSRSSLSSVPIFFFFVFRHAEVGGRHGERRC